jgi:hypothetical protein
MMAARAAILGAALMAACRPTVTDCPTQIGWICPVAGTGEMLISQDGAPAEDTGLALVSSIRRGPDGRVWLMDYNSQRLRLIDDDGTVRTVAGNGEHAIADTTVPALDSPLENPIDFRFLSDQRPVFVSAHDPRVLVVEPSGGLTAIAGSGEIGVEGDEGDGGPALEAAFMELSGIEVDDGDVVWVSDWLGHRVRKIEAGTIATVAGTGEKGFSGDGGPATQAALSSPSALLLASDGALLIADTLNHRIRRLAVDGTIDTVAGTGEIGFSGDGGPARDARLASPFGLALDDAGNLYVADRDNVRVRRILPDGTIDTIAGTGEPGLSGDGGPAVDAELSFLARLFVDDTHLLVADQGNSVARLIVLP